MTNDTYKEEIQQRRSRWMRPWQDWALLICAFALTILIRGALYFWSLGTVIRGLRSAAKKLPTTDQISTERSRSRAAWAANAVGNRLLPKRPCLVKALVLQFFLLRLGDERAELHIGVARGEDGKLLAHAWVERNGKVIIGGTASPKEYTRFDRLNERVWLRED